MTKRRCHLTAYPAYSGSLNGLSAVQEQGKLAEALEVVSGKLGQAIQMEEERDLLKANLMVPFRLPFLEFCSLDLLRISTKQRQCQSILAFGEFATSTLLLGSSPL